MQLFDLTTAIAVHRDLVATCLPARVEIVQQTDLYTLHLALRTLQGRQWITLSWHPQAARFHSGRRVPKQPDPFQFSGTAQRLRGLALSAIVQIDPWERVFDWQFAPRPQDDVQFHLYLETMGKYSNIVLVDADGAIVSSGRGVSDRQSSVRPIQPGLAYEPPPALIGAIPSQAESFEDWKERLDFAALPLGKQLFRTYRGLSRAVLAPIAAAAGVTTKTATNAITLAQWQALFEGWQHWLDAIETGNFQLGLTADGGYDLLGYAAGSTDNPDLQTLHPLLDRYYECHLNQQQFDRDRHRLQQKLGSVLKKLNQRRQQFDDMLAKSARADEPKRAADLLMAHMHQWEVGMSDIQLPDFDSGEPVEIVLDPEKNAIANAQVYYKRHQKQKRAKDAVTPLKIEVMAEIHYLEQVLGAIEQLENYRTPADLQALVEIERELIAECYLPDPDRPTVSVDIKSAPQQFLTPSGFEVLVGRNNRQNDILTFKLAQTNDWWFHAQEIPGSHVLLRLPSGAVAEDEDLQMAADLAAFFSRARLSEQVPTIYTRPKHVFRLKGAEAKPGMVTYLHQKVWWAKPKSVEEVISQAEQTSSNHLSTERDPLPASK
ncbi:MAG: NFACT RNA binding domain-containing protein [Cyanobacteria bacterium P01_A01_bin.3]